MSKKTIILFICILLVFAAAASVSASDENSFFSKIIDFFKDLFGIKYNNPNDYRIESESTEYPLTEDNISNVPEEIILEDNLTTNITQEVEGIQENNLMQEEIKNKEEIERDKIYAWKIRLLFAEEISEDESDEFKEELSKNEEVIFDKFEENILYFNATDKAKENIDQVMNFTKATIQSTYFNFIPFDQKNATTDNEIYFCKEDRECITAFESCCECDWGETATTINRAYYTYWEEKLNCSHMFFCPGAISNHWTCHVEPKCIENQCKLVQ